ncbi:MAG: glycosyl hydrolase [Planctomycetota bacterium]|nr:glycosyl hydrolase [Planctomycetota bacterium]
MNIAILILAATALLASPALSAEGAIAISTEITPTKISASSAYNSGQKPENLINGSGLNGDIHDNNASAGTMWHTTEHPAATAPAAGLPGSPAWVRVEFAEPKKINEVHIWNHNQAGLTDRGFRKTRLYGTADGTAWFKLTAAETVELPRGGDRAFAISVAADKPIRSVIIAAESNYGSAYYGLSEIKFFEVGQVAADAVPFPAGIECKPQACYRHRPDSKPGREVSVNLKGTRLYSAAELLIETDDGLKETVAFPSKPGGYSSLTALLPEGVGVGKDAKIKISLRAGKSEVSQDVMVPKKRLWTVYLYSHSHVDIGYTNTQKNCELLHRTNLLEGAKLGKETLSWPAGSRSVWNPEVTWPLERLWANGSQADRDAVMEAIKNGSVRVDASYVNEDTSAANDEELFQLFTFSRKMQKETGLPMDTLQQLDVPGMSWGLVPVMAQLGVHYIMTWPNSCRAGHTHANLDGKPCWWIGPDGKSKVLFFQPGGYGNSGSMGKGGALGRPWFGQPDHANVPPAIRAGSANVNFIGTCDGRDKPDYPYDFIVLSWSLWDNSPIDADVPAAVKKWNGEYASPRIVLTGGHEIMEMIEKRYGDKLPVVHGDFTEYWTDGLGSAAGPIATNRNAKEHIVQAETLWAMLHPGRTAPRAEFDEAWRHSILGSEHTWCAENPNDPYFQERTWKGKLRYFREADERSRDVMDEALAPAGDKANGAFGPGDGPSGGGVAVFNTQSWAHGGLVTLSRIESSRGGRVLGPGDKEVLAQRLCTGDLVFLAEDVAPLASAHYRVVQDKCKLIGACKIDGSTKLENGVLRLELDSKTGNIIHLVDIASGRDFADAKVDGGLNAFRWLRGADDGKDAKPDEVISIEVSEKGPLVVELRVTSKAPGCRSVTRSVGLVHGQKFVECADVVDKLPLMDKDGVHFGFAFDISGGRTRVDIPWGVMELEKDQWPQANRNWLVLQRWLDISNEKEGVTWCSLDAPLFESGAMTANQSGSWKGEPHPWLTKLEPRSNVYSWVMNNHWFTNFPLAQDGPVLFRYRILPHQGGFDASAANRFGLEQAQPLVALVTSKNPVPQSVLAIDNPCVVVTILRGEEDGTQTIRLRSLSEKPETVNVTRPGKPAIPAELLPYGCASINLK